MCKTVEDYANEVAVEREKLIIRNLFANGCTLDVVIASLATVPEELIRKIYDEIMENKRLA